MTMTVGDAATSAGVTAKAVRLWESKGLLPSAQRTDAGYRLFTDEDLDVLRFIRQAKALDLSLTEIKEILDLQRGGEVVCTRVTELLDTHIADIDRTISELSNLRNTLDRARRSADEHHRRGHKTVFCRIIESVPVVTQDASTTRPLPQAASTRD